jgi:hypothetical protein
MRCAAFAILLMAGASPAMAADPPPYIQYMERWEVVADAVAATGMCRELGFDVDVKFNFSKYADRLMAEALKDGISRDFTNRTVLQMLKESKADFAFLQKQAIEDGETNEELLANAHEWLDHLSRDCSRFADHPDVDWIKHGTPEREAGALEAAKQTLRDGIAKVEAEVAAEEAAKAAKAGRK